MRHHRFALACLVATSIAMPVLAAGGGGGGGGMMPSDSAPSYDPAEEYRKGVAALEAKDFKAAKTAFDRVISAAPRDANTQYLAGLSRTGLGDWKGARRFFEKAVKLDDNLIGAHRELGVAQARLGDMPKAQTTLATLNAKSATCAGSCAQAADLKTAVDAVQAAINGGPQAAISATTSLLFADASNGDSAYLHAVSLINEKRYEEAITSLRSAQQAFGPHPDILTYLGFANRKLKRFDVAEAHYRAALAIAPDHRGATEYFGELMVERGDLAGARAMLAKLDRVCRFGCAEAEELRGWISAGRSPHS
jgi:tetratricopeptide (TPR) repeat protein